MTKPRRGILIALCGIDGSGKSTQETMLAEWLTAMGANVLVTKQPTDRYRRDPQIRGRLYGTGSEIGLAEMALMAAVDRQFHLRTVIRPAMEQGRVVLCNRYVYSSYAFFLARGLRLDFVKAINPNVEKPDLTVLCDLPAVEARGRVNSRDGAIVKAEEARLDFMEQVRRNFLAVADETFLTVDARLPAEACQAAIRRRLVPILENGSPGPAPAGQ